MASTTLPWPDERDRLPVEGAAERRREQWVTQRIGPIKRLARSARALRIGMNLWPPFLFTGVRVLAMDQDFRRVRVRLAHSPLTSNYFGTQFGGSLFTMVDPFWVIMLARNLGGGYTVWDRRAEIVFEAPGRTAVTAELLLDAATLADIRERADTGEKVLHWFETELCDREGTVVARVRKQVYVRRRR